MSLGLSLSCTPSADPYDEILHEDKNLEALAVQ